MKTYESEGSKEIKRHIAASVFELLKEKPLSGISVGEVAKKASVGRTTFYRYFGAKEGLRDALLYDLLSGYEDAIKAHAPSSSEERDAVFLDYLYACKGKIRLLKRDSAEGVLDSLAFRVFGPSDEGDDYYLKCVGAGLWVGLIRSLIERDFSDPPEEVRRSIAEGLIKIAAGGAK
jgi:AcrR family transcriptional regulator